MEAPVTRDGNVGIKRGGKTLHVAVGFPDPQTHTARPINCPSATSAETNQTGSRPKEAGQSRGQDEMQQWK